MALDEPCAMTFITQAQVAMTWLGGGGGKEVMSSLVAPAGVLVTVFKYDHFAHFSIDVITF